MLYVCYILAWTHHSLSDIKSVSMLCKYVCFWSIHSVCLMYAWCMLGRCMLDVCLQAYIVCFMRHHACMLTKHTMYALVCTKHTMYALVLTKHTLYALEHTLYALVRTKHTCKHTLYALLPTKHTMYACPPSIQYSTHLCLHMHLFIAVSRLLSRTKVALPLLHCFSNQG